MLHITDDMVAAAVSATDAQEVLRDAFIEFGSGRAAIQERVRTESGGIKLSTLGAVIPAQGVVGAKVYTTIEGRFAFLITLFSAVDGRPLAALEANAITGLRTAACSVIAARMLARRDATRLALFGAGVQGRAHARQMAGAFPLSEILVCARRSDPAIAESITAESGVAARSCTTAEAVAAADIVVTATRATSPLFAGGDLRPGAFVAAIGSSLPHTRELDDTALARASLVAVEWRPQSLRETGDLVLADPAALAAEKIVELGALVTGMAAGRRRDDEITIYKSVGVGLADIALAGLAYRRIAAA